MPEIREHRGALEGQPVFWRSAIPLDAVAVPPLYLHGVPTSSDDWLGFLGRTGGLAPDLPGFGRSSKRGDLDYIPARFGDGYAAVLGDARVVHLKDAGHWAWVDRPDAVDAVAEFFAGAPLPAAFA